MKSLKFIAIFIFLQHLAVNGFGQGVIVHLKDGSSINYPYSKIDSIVAYSFDKDKGVAYGHEYVDLGLPSGLKWATCNVGAESPEEYGGYYAWGETQEKDIYASSTYKYYQWKSSLGVYQLTKYCTQSYGGSVDNKTVLELEDDAANMKWGGNWRMPTIEEFNELRELCTWDWTSHYGIYGFMIIGPNGNSIFLPAAGMRDEGTIYNKGAEIAYWSSSLYVDNPFGSYCLNFCSKWRDSINRIYGFSIRPVTK